ncbi:MAG: hypothetical protein V9E89_13055 [Ilumatobacteraceae bacterium]
MPAARRARGTVAHQSQTAAHREPVARLGAPADPARMVRAAVTAKGGARPGGPVVRALLVGAAATAAAQGVERAAGRHGPTATALSRRTGRAGRELRCAAANLDPGGRGSTGWPVAAAPRAVASATNRRPAAAARHVALAPRRPVHGPRVGGVIAPLARPGPLATTSAPARAVAMTGWGRAAVIRASLGARIAAQRMAAAGGCRRARLPSR